MPIRILITAVVVATLLTLQSHADDEAVALKIVRDEGSTWKVEQTLELASKSKGATSFAGGAGTAQMRVKGHVTVKEKWTDKVEKFEEGRVVELKRTVGSSKIKAQKGGSQRTGLHKAVLVFECNADGHEVRATKGAPSELSLELLAAGPIDAVEILLPPEPVVVGDEWEIGTLDVMRFQQQICIGVAAAKGSSRDGIGLL